MASAQDFESRVAETQSGADEVRDFALKASYAFPSADVLVPAPMAVSILGQLTLVATTTDFKLVQPTNGFKHVRYPDSFRATIMQLVNTGALSLNQSFVNFDEINKRCAAVRPGVNNIVQLLVGDEDNTPRQNEIAVERHLPNQIAALSKTIQACLEKAKETDTVFNQLLELTMEIHESCAATQGENEERVREAELRKAFLAKQEEAAKEMKSLSKDAAEQAREKFTNAQNQFNHAADHMPGAWQIASLELLDMAKSTISNLTFGLLGGTKSSGGGQPSAGPARREPSIDVSDALDPGFQKASTLRYYAEMLDRLLVPREGGGQDWDAIRSYEPGGCRDVKVGLQEICKSIKLNHKHAGNATNTALNHAKKGAQFASQLLDTVPPGKQADIEQLISDIHIWRDRVLEFAAEADLKLRTSHIGNNAFLPEPDYSPSGSSAELLVRNAQYRLTVTQAQLSASREASRAASEKLMEVTGQLGDILAQIAKVDVQKQNWEDIKAILLRAIDFLCQLKMYLNNLVHFFDQVNTLVSVTLREAADQFIRIVKDATAIENGPGKEVQRISGISLDAWARQAIYNHAISVAKISRVVENISDMYVTLYDSNVHPGVNMLLGMGGLVGSKDVPAIAKAGQEIQTWAQGASDKIVELVAERMDANEQDIQKRMSELEKSLGSILPPSRKIEEIVQRAKEKQTQETTDLLDATVKANPVYRKKAKVFV
ncbi:hypothetical protein C8Q74DRAFT_1314667 [Fomes fomentarius]|nr:hypothetical protein C8Q74DRAFT_1314667 [Fomes fomentarius]